MSLFTSINSLPDDVLARIFWHSDRPTSSLSLFDYYGDDKPDRQHDPHFSTPRASTNVAHVLLIASVCLRWRKLAHESVTTLHVSPDRFVSRQDLKRVVESFPNLTHLHLSNGSMETIDDNFLAFLGSSSPNLTALHVGSGIAPENRFRYGEEEIHNDSDHPVTSAGLDILFRGCRRLEQLSLQCLHWKTKFPLSFFQLTRLHTLSLGEISLLKDPNLANLASLTKLSIQKRDMRLHQMSSLTSLPNLTSLFFPGEASFRDFEGGFSFGQLTALRSLGFVRGSRDFPSMFPSESPCFRLQRLLLTNVPNILHEGLGERFPALLELCLSKIDDDSTESGDSLASISTLEVLTLSDCSITSLPENLGVLSSLKSLVLSSWSLEKLPDSIGLLTGLQKLSIDSMNIDFLPAAISCLAALELLSIRHLQLSSIPEEIGELTNLRTLELNWCRALQKLPSSLSRLSSLTRLEISMCPTIASLPEGTGQLRELRELILSHCINLTEVPESITQLSRLKTLTAPMCVMLVSAPRAMGNLSYLRELDLRGCYQLKETIKTLPRCLEALGLGNDSSSTILPDMSSAPNLKKLQLIQVATMDATSSRCLSQIEHLDMLMGAEQREFPLLLSFLSCLRVLHISRAKTLQHLPYDIGSLPQLRQLRVEGAESLKEIPASVGQLVHLRSLHIEAPNLTHLPETISSLSRLGDISLRCCSSLTSLPCSITALTYLHRLDARRTSLQVLPPNFHHLIRLRELDLSYCEQLRSLPQELQHMTMLQELNVCCCKLLGPDSVPSDVYARHGLEIDHEWEDWEGARAV